MNKTGVYIWIFNIVERILRELYTHFGECVLIAVLCVFSIQLFEQNGIKNTISETVKRMRSEYKFRIYFFAFLYIAFLLSMTVLGRQRQENPLVNVIGDWGINNLDNAENLILFMPYGFLYFKIMECRNNKIGDKLYIRNATLTAFFLSSSIEVIQFIFSTGTFQLSDITMNTVGAFLGVVFGCIIKRNRNRKE